MTFGPVAGRRAATASRGNRDAGLALEVELRGQPFRVLAEVLGEADHEVVAALPLVDLRHRFATHERSEKTGDRTGSDPIGGAAVELWNDPELGNGCLLLDAGLREAGNLAGNFGDLRSDLPELVEVVTVDFDSGLWPPRPRACARCGRPVGQTWRKKFPVCCASSGAWNR